MPRYKVERECHEGDGGVCDKCHGRKGKIIITQMNNLGESVAKQIAFNWRHYNAKAVEEAEENIIKGIFPANTLDKISEVCKIVAARDQEPYVLEEQNGNFEYRQNVVIDNEKYEVVVKKI